MPGFKRLRHQSHAERRFDEQAAAIEASVPQPVNRRAAYDRFPTDAPVVRPRRQASGYEPHPDVTWARQQHGVAHTTGGRMLPLNVTASYEDQEARLADQSGWDRHVSFAPSQPMIQGAQAYSAKAGLGNPHTYGYDHVRQTPETVRTVGRHYDALPTYDERAIPHYEALRNEVNNQYHHLTNGMGVNVQSVDYDPYADVHEMMHDLTNNNRLKVLGTRVTGSHPFFTDDENDKFRAVHDAFGHAATGRSFDRHGEQAAYLAHSQMFSPKARGALATETKGQNSSLILNGQFGPQKLAIMDPEHWNDSSLSGIKPPSAPKMPGIPNLSASRRRSYHDFPVDFAFRRRADLLQGTPDMPKAPSPAPAPMTAPTPAPAAPSDDDILKSKGVTYNQMLDNLQSHYDSATPEQKLRGRVWYKAGSDTMKDIAALTGKSVRKSIATAAALSARTDWRDNVQYAAHFLNSYNPDDPDNENRWRLPQIHPEAMAKYMERYGEEPGVHDDQFTHKELKGLYNKGMMPRNVSDFRALAKLHGDIVSRDENGVPRMDKRTGQPIPHQMSVLATDPKAQDEWIKAVRDNGYQNVIDAHMRAVKDTTGKRHPAGYEPTGDEKADARALVKYFSPTSAFRGAGLPTTGGNINIAKRIHDAPDTDEAMAAILGGDKYNAFNNNLTDHLDFREPRSGDPDDVGYYEHPGGNWENHDPRDLLGTIDTQHMRASSAPAGGTPLNYAEGSQINPDLYKVYAKGLMDLTRRINAKEPDPAKHILPKQVQAVVWGTFKDAMNAKKKERQQTYWAPGISDQFEPHHTRYLSRLAGFIDHELLHPTNTDPKHPESHEWWNKVVDSWIARHLGGHREGY